MKVVAVIIFSATLSAQSMSGTITRRLFGDLVERTGTPQPTELVLRSIDHYVHRCQSTPRTVYEAVTATDVRVGDRMEWLVETRGVGRVCELKSARLITRPPTIADALASTQPRVRINTNPLNSIAPRGNIMHGGVVTGIHENRLTLRLRGGVYQSILLRRDTHFFGEGVLADRSQLQLNQRVWVRLGKNLDGDLEAFYVAWGGILRPE